MKTKFITSYDYLQGILGLVSSIILLSINTNIGTVILALSILNFGVYKTFSRLIVFSQNNIKARNFFFSKEIDYLNINEIKFTTHLYGKSFITIYTGKKQHKGYLSYENWQRLKPWVQKKGIKCTEKR